MQNTRLPPTFLFASLVCMALAAGTVSAFPMMGIANGSTIFNGLLSFESLDGCGDFARLDQGVALVDGDSLAVEFADGRPWVKYKGERRAVFFDADSGDSTAGRILISSAAEFATPQRSVIQAVDGGVVQLSMLFKDMSCTLKRDLTVSVAPKLRGKTDVPLEVSNGKLVAIAKEKTKGGKANSFTVYFDRYGSFWNRRNIHRTKGPIFMAYETDTDKTYWFIMQERNGILVEKRISGGR